MSTLSFLLLFSFILFTKSTTISPSNWMSVLPSDIRLQELNIAGTCHSVASQNTTGVALIKHQHEDLLDQLEMGVRFFDLHFGFINNELVSSEGDAPLSGPYTIPSQIFDVFVYFLRINQDETIFASVTMETSEVQKAAFLNTLTDLIANETYDGYWYDKSTLGPLSEAKGKIILIRGKGINNDDEWPLQEPQCFPLPLNTPTNQFFDVEDHTNVSVNDKIMLIQAHLNQTNNAIQSDSSSSKLSITYTQMSLLPSNEGELETESQFVNDAISTFLQHSPRGYYGIVVLDYPGDEVLEEIINSNFFDINENVTSFSGKHPFITPPIQRWVVGMICGTIASVALIVVLIIIYRDSLVSGEEEDEKEKQYSKL